MTAAFHKHIPRTAQRLAQPQHRREQDVYPTGLDFLHGADVEIRQLGQQFLRDLLAHPLPAEIRTKSFDLRGLF